MKIIHLHNKKAWEEAYDLAPEAFKHITDQLKNDPNQFLNPLIEEALMDTALSNLKVAQFSCNNGREILALQRVYHIKEVYGFDIAENMIEAAKRTSSSLNQNATFIQTDLLEINASFDGYFDIVIMMIGAISWFQDLNELFSKVSQTLKKGGRFILIDGHPVTGMFAFEDEDEYNPNCPLSLQIDYFKTTPFVDNNGMFYMTKKTYTSLPFTSYNHTMGDIVNGMIHHNLTVLKLKESNLDLLESFPHLNEKHVPLTFLMIGEKHV
jgi:SAM-dependent methyltransferase